MEHVTFSLKALLSVWGKPDSLSLKEHTPGFGRPSFLSHWCHYLGSTPRPRWISVSSTQVGRSVLMEHIGTLSKNRFGGKYPNPPVLVKRLRLRVTWASSLRIVYKATSSFEILEGCVYCALWEKVGLYWLPLCSCERELPCVWLYPSVCI